MQHRLGDRTMSTERQGAYDESIIDIEMSSKWTINKRKRPKIERISSALNRWWQTIQVASSVIAVVFDPLFFYIPYTSEVSKCMGSDKRVQTAALIFRSVTDIPILVQIIYQLYVAITFAASRVSQHGSLGWEYEPRPRYPIIHFAKAFSSRLSWRSFLLTDVFAIFPMPQLLIVGMFFDNGGVNYVLRRNVMIGFLLIQYVPRIYRIYISNTRLRPSKIWVKCAYNFFLYLLASHVLGSFWYFFSVQREISCWYQNCIDTKRSESECTFYCHGDINAALITPELNQTLNDRCILKVPASMADPPFDFGMFSDALKHDIQGKVNILQKMGYCIWWGLRNLSNFGTSLETSTYLWENIFAILISIIGLLLFSFLIADSTQVYIQIAAVRSETVRRKIEKKKMDIDMWMVKNGLADDMKDEIMKNIKQKLEADINVDLEDIVSILPRDTKKALIHVLCMSTLRRVPILSRVHEELLNMMCDYLEPVRYQENSLVFQRGEPLDLMLVITDGIMETYKPATENSQSMDTNNLKKGDYYGDLLLQFASSSLTAVPTSTANVRCQTNVEAFVLTAKSLRNIVNKGKKYWPCDYNPSTDEAADQVAPLGQFQQQHLPN